MTGVLPPPPLPPPASFRLGVGGTASSLNSYVLVLISCVLAWSSRVLGLGNSFDSDFSRGFWAVVKYQLWEVNRQGCVASLRQTGETDQNSDLRGVGLNRQGCVASLRQTGETDQKSDFRGLG